MGLSFLGWKGIRVGAPQAAHTASYISRSAALRAIATGSLLGIAASLATNRLVLETLFGIELLLASGEHELGTAITANENLVFEHFG